MAKLGRQVTFSGLLFLSLSVSFACPFYKFYCVLFMPCPSSYEFTSSSSSQACGMWHVACLHLLLLFSLAQRLLFMCTLDWIVKLASAGGGERVQALRTS